MTGRVNSNVILFRLDFIITSASICSVSDNESRKRYSGVYLAKNRKRLPNVSLGIRPCRSVSNLGKPLDGAMMIVNFCGALLRVDNRGRHR
jgi:hypothetical protein